MHCRRGVRRKSNIEEEPGRLTTHKSLRVVASRHVVTFLDPCLWILYPAMSDEPAPAPAEAPPAEADSPAPAGSSDAAPGPTPSSKEADQVRLYLGNLSYDSDEPRLRSLFSEFGEVTDIFLPEDRSTGRRRGFGFVTFAERAAAEVAIAKMDQAEVDGRTIKVNESRPRGDGPGFNASGAPTVKLYVGNLAFETNEESVRALFEKHGAVSDCFLPVDRESGRPRGFAFVTMSSEDARTAMSAIDGMEIEGRAIRVSESKPKASDRDRGGGGGYGGGGYGGESTRPLAAFPSVSSRPTRVPLSPPAPCPPPPSCVQLLLPHRRPRRLRRLRRRPRTLRRPRRRPGPRL